MWTGFMFWTSHHTACDRTLLHDVLESLRRTSSRGSTKYMLVPWENMEDPATPDLLSELHSVMPPACDQQQGLVAEASWAPTRYTH